VAVRDEDPLTNASLAVIVTSDVVGVTGVPPNVRFDPDCVTEIPDGSEDAVKDAIANPAFEVAVYTIGVSTVSDLPTVHE